MTTRLRDAAIILVASAVIAWVPAAERGAQAQVWHGDIQRFRDHDLARWNDGHWMHGNHAGRSGWWWVVGPLWYWYPAPVYPTPNPYLPPAAAAIMSPAASDAGPTYWYYCADPAGYYPYVSECSASWQRIQAVS